jgi:uncharacterized membrane protein
LQEKKRFDFIDWFRGLVIILMLVDHCSYYFNSIWLHFDPFDPLFPDWGQFALRYAGYICAPGFLIINGAMVWWSYSRRRNQNIPDLTARWQIIKRGIFLIVLQMTWVNSSWGGFSAFKPWHFGIISCIGFSMILQTLIINTRWQVQLCIALGILAVHPFLIEIPYNSEVTWASVLMQTFIDAGEFNKYPLLPWFALAMMGSVMANGWLSKWKTDKKRIFIGLGIAVIAILLAIAIRMSRGYGNIFPFSEFGSFSFFFDQKYPPSLFFSLWFFGFVVLVISVLIAIGKVAPKLFIPLEIAGKVALFFYCMHIAIMGILSKRIGLFYREGDVAATLTGVALMLLIMLPLSKWFEGVKRRSKNFLLRMI